MQIVATLATLFLSETFRWLDVQMPNLRVESAAVQCMMYVSCGVAASLLLPALRIRHMLLGCAVHVVCAVLMSR